MADDPEPYGVGYGKPPEHSRFKPGQSGNRKGRPKNSKNLSTIVKNAASERVVVHEKGRRRSMSKIELTVKQLATKAASGDAKAAREFLNLVRTIEDAAQDTSLPVTVLSGADQAVADGFVSRILKMQDGQIPSQQQGENDDESHNKN